MKFFSKQANYRFVLTPGIPAERVTGKAAINGIHIKFSDGVVNIEDEENIKAMKENPKCGRDFFPDEDKDKAPASIHNRKSVEPEHDMVEIQYGHIGKNLNPKNPLASLKGPQLLLIKEMAKEMAKEMVKEVMKSEALKKANLNEAEQKTVDFLEKESDKGEEDGEEKKDNSKNITSDKEKGNKKKSDK